MDINSPTGRRLLSIAGCSDQRLVYDIRHYNEIIVVGDSFVARTQTADDDFVWSPETVM